MKISSLPVSVCVLMLVGLLLSACGDDNATNTGVDQEPANNTPNNTPNNAPNNDPQEICAEVALPDEPRAVGLIYTDSDETDVSTYVGGYEGGRDDPLAGLSVSLFGAGLEETTTTCRDGRVAYGPLEDGVYLMAPEYPDADCSSKNCARRLPEAIREGQVKIVTFGDSIPVQGAQPLFPARLATLLGDITEVDNTNIAVGGTLSVNWMPGTPNFENRLMPEVPDADVIMISLGGNDILAFVQQNIANLGNIDALVMEVFDVVEGIVDNLLTIVAAIREQNPNADIVYCLYPDYSRADNNMMWSLVNQFVGAEVVRDVLETARASLPTDENVILVDVFGATQDTDVDDILADPLHFNDIGQTLYAEEVFKALGGILVGPSPLGGQPRTPLNLEQQFSVTP